MGRERQGSPWDSCTENPFQTAGLGAALGAFWPPSRRRVSVLAGAREKSPLCDQKSDSDILRHPLFHKKLAGKAYRILGQGKGLGGRESSLGNLPAEADDDEAEHFLFCAHKT